MQCSQRRFQVSNIKFEDALSVLYKPNKVANTYQLPSVSFPQGHLDTSAQSLTSGISMTPSMYSENITYDQDVFSELPVIVFDDSHNRQMAEFMRSFREEFFKRIANETRKIIPKMIYYFDKEESAENIRLSSEWAEGNAMLYFSFERTSSESNFGMIWNDSQKKNYQTRSGNLCLNPKDGIIRETIDFVFRVY